MYRRAGLFVAIALTAPFASSAQTMPAPVPAVTPAVTSPTPSGRIQPTEAEKAARAKFRTACSADLAKLCPDAVPVAATSPEQAKAQRALIRACIDTNKAALSAGCRAAIVERDAARAPAKS